MYTVSWDVHSAISNFGDGGYLPIKLPYNSVGGTIGLQDSLGGPGIWQYILDMYAETRTGLVVVHTIVKSYGVGINSRPSLYPLNDTTRPQSLTLCTRKPKISLRGLPIFNNFKATKTRIRTYMQDKESCLTVCSILDYYTHQRKGAKVANVSCLN